MTTIFVTSSGTDVGKTYVTERLVRTLRAKGFAVAARKPLISGFTSSDVDKSDTGRILLALGRTIDTASVDEVSPMRLSAPLSPDMAARFQGTAVDFNTLVDHSRARPAHDVTIVEGVGGVMVPLDDDHTVLDWVAALDAPTLLIVGSALGALSHALTAFSVLQTRGVDIAAVVVNESAESTVPLNETVRSLTSHVGETPIFVTRRGGELSPDLVDHVCSLFAPASVARAHR